MSAETSNADFAAQQAQTDRRSRHEAAAAQFLHSGGRSIDKGDPDDWKTPSKEYAQRAQRDSDNRRAANSHYVDGKVYGNGFGRQALPGYSEHDYADEDGQRQ